MTYFANAGQILVNFLFGALIALLVLRVLLQCVRANFYNPICQFIYKLTNPVLMPMRKVIPAWRNLDIAGVLLAWLLTAIEYWLVYAMAGQSLGVLGLAVMALGYLIDFVFILYIGLILLYALISFISVERSNPVVPLVFQLIDPLMRPVRRRLPSAGGLDFSPMVVLLGILLARVLIALPIVDFGLKLAQAA
jgi:YggT family protein